MRRRKSRCWQSSTVGADEGSGRASEELARVLAEALSWVRERMIVLRWSLVGRGRAARVEAALSMTGTTMEEEDGQRHLDAWRWQACSRMARVEEVGGAQTSMQAAMVESMDDGSRTSGRAENAIF